MSYQQLVTPNLDPVVYQYGAALEDWLGWCLAVAWTAFGGKTTNPTAWEAWTKSVQYQHPGEQPPAGVYVPIWFSGYGGSGHVAIYKDGTVWSSPFTHKPYMDVLPSIAEVERIYGVTYVGWSEDIGGVRVVTNEGNPMKQELAAAIAKWGRLLGFNSEEKMYSAQADDTAHIMADPMYAAGLLESLYKGEWQVPADKASRYDALAAQAADLSKTVATQEAEIKDLQAKLAVQSDDTTNLNSVGVALQWLIKRLGLTK